MPQGDADALAADAQSLEVQIFGEQVVGCDGGPHGGISPYKARWSLEGVMNFGSGTIA
jgi:hypothetical protein